MYYACVQNPDTFDDFRWAPLCCDDGMTWDKDFLRCVKKEATDSCVDSREQCPDPDVDVFQLPCTKLLHFAFTEEPIVSTSCYHEIYQASTGTPSVTDGALELSGFAQFTTIPYMGNWFQVNPIINSFSMCIWLRSDTNRTTAVMSLGGADENNGKVAEFLLQSGSLVAKLGQSTLDLGVFPHPTWWSNLCVTFDHGHYVLYFNGTVIKETHETLGQITFFSPFSLGYIPRTALFKGFFDDWCFWTSTLDKGDIVDFYKTGPSVVLASDTAKKAMTTGNERKRVGKKQQQTFWKV